jgi:hypothetical protein
MCVCVLCDVAHVFGKSQLYIELHIICQECTFFSKIPEATSKFQTPEVCREGSSDVKIYKQ